MIQSTPLKLRIKKNFLICPKVWKTVKCQGIIREKSGNFEVDEKWQPYGEAGMSTAICMNPTIFLTLSPYMLLVTKFNVVGKG